MSARTFARQLGKLAGLGAALATARPRPFSITFILTHRCNFRCDYCDIPAAADDELSTGELCRAIDELADAGMARASFSGGEVLLRPDSLEIIGHAKSRGMFTSLNTNGWLTPRHLPALAPVLDMLVVSLDGPADVHDEVRRRPGSFERVLATLAGARALGLATATITVVGPWNASRVEDVLALTRAHSAWAYFQPAYVDCFEHAAGLRAGIGPELFHRLADDLEDARARGLPVGASAGYTERLRGGPRFGDCSRCAAGRYFATVMPDGMVVPCHLTSGHAARDGRSLGFARAFASLPRPQGPGCAISPYQETDLIFGLDPRALRAAFARMRPAASGARAAGPDTRRR